MVVIFLPRHRRARSDRIAPLAVDVNRTRAAQAGAAAEFRPGHLQLFAMAHSSGVSFAASTDIFRPLTFRLGMSLPLRCMMPTYGGNSLWLMVWHPPGRCRPCARE